MTAFLLALGSCGDALEATAAQAALAAAGARCDVAWFGPHDRLCDARALGLPEPAAAAAAPATASAERCEAVASFAAELLRRPWRAVVTLGHGDFVTALGRAALAAGTPVVRLAAGLRTHAAGDPHDDARRAADHAASHWLCDREARRHELLAEGCDPARITVPGSLLAAALAARTGHAAGAVVVAFERAAAFAAPDRLVRQLTALAAVGAPVRLLPTPQARAFLARHPETIAGVRMSPDGDGPSQLAELLGARLVVTDSVGHQRLAHARGLRCVVAARAGVLADALAAGGFAVAGDDDDGLAAAARRALADAPPPAEAAAAAAARTADALLAIAADPSPARIVLPSDGDCTGRTLGAEEAILAADAVRRGTLNSTRGVYVQAFERRFAAWLGRKHAIACASGSAAMHCAIAALRLQAGDEVVTTPITDMGALTPILYEGGVPVFADVDPTTLNVTPATVAARITGRTRAIVVTHLFGRPVDLDGFAALAHAHGLPLIEDAAQAFGATWRDRRIGGFGALACFSLQQGKHITTGEGGIVATDDDDLARRVFLYVNKAWGYGDKKPDHYFPALNYRLTEVQGAIALAQLPKLDGVVAARRRVAAMLQQGLADLPGIGLPGDPPHGCHAWWKFAFRVDAEVVPGGALALGQRMQQAGVACVPRYVQKPAFECELFRDWSRSPVTAMPLAHNPRGAGPQPPFRREDFPGAVRGLEQVVVLPINERYEARHVDHVCDAIRAGVGALQHA